MTQREAKEYLMDAFYTMRTDQLVGETMIKEFLNDVADGRIKITPRPPANVRPLPSVLH